MAEKKYIDTLGTIGPVTSTQWLAPQSLCEITQNIGDAANRIGDKLTMRSLEFRFSSEMDLSFDQVSSCMWRLVIFQWHDNTVPVAADIIQNTSAQYILTSPLDHDLKVKRTILYDNCFPVQTYVTPNGNGERLIVARKIFIPLISKKGLKRVVDYETATTTATDKLWFLYGVKMATTAVLPGKSSSTITVDARLNYIDM